MEEINQRRYDIDWIRVVAIGLLLIYHITISFQPWGILFRFIQSKESLEKLWIPMALLNVWRIPILFLISGMGVFFALKKRTLKELIIERTRRILIPLIFGSFCIVPLHIFIIQKYYQQEISYSAGVGHLWFLANIFIYVVVLAPVFVLMNKNRNGKMGYWTKKITESSFGIYLFLIPFILEVTIIQPESFTLYLFTIHGFFLGFLAFFSGFYFVWGGISFWNAVKKLRFVNLIMAFSLYMIRLLFFDLSAPVYLICIEMMMWMYAIIGLSYAYLNFKSYTISYLSKAAYPVYIIHMFFQYLSNYIIFPLNIHVVWKYIMVIIFTFLCSFLFYELVIRRINVIGPLFGLIRKT